MINTPDNSKEVAQRMKTDVQRELPSSNPFLKNSWLGAIITSIANRIFDFYMQLAEAIRQSMPDTATLTNLERWSSIWGINRLAATAANGNIVATGLVASVVPISTVYAASDGTLYSSDSSATIINQILTIASITRSGSTVTVVTVLAHNIASNVAVNITGANETDYNVVGAVIQVVDSTTFTYVITTTPASPATGTLKADGDFITVPVTAQSFGAATNQLLDTVMTLQSPITGVDNNASVDFGEFAGGADQETDTGLRSRLISRIQNPVSHFNVAAIDAKAKEVSGVTRVFVEEITPLIGQVTIYFMRDNDTNSIPTSPEVATVKAKILEIKPANTSSADVIVSAPTAVLTPFTFSALVPNTSTMQLAIIASLEQFFDEDTIVGLSVDADLYRAAIANTIDTATGDKITSFTLSAPTIDIVVAPGEISILDTVTYP